MAEDDKPNVFEKFVDDVKNFATSFVSDVSSIFSGGEDSGTAQPSSGAPVSGSSGRNVDADLFAGSKYTVTRSPDSNKFETGISIDDDDDDDDDVVFGGGYGSSPTSIAAVQLADPDYKPVTKDTTLSLTGGKKPGYGTVTAVPGTTIVDKPESYLSTKLRDSTFGKLVGINSSDPIVGSVNGKPIYRKADGTTYAYNAIGLPYDTVSATSLEEDPKQVKKREQMMLSSQRGDDDDDDDDFLIDEEEDIAEIDPCPEGYIMNEETGVCELDPFQVPFADPVTTTTTLPPATGVVTQTAGVPGAYTQLPASPLTAGVANLTQFVPPTPYATPITVAAQTPQGLASLRRS